MIEVEIVNKIGEKIEEYQKRTGATKTWIAKQIGYKTKQALDGAILSSNPTIETIAKISLFLNCNPEELYIIKYVKLNEGESIISINEDYKL